MTEATFNRLISLADAYLVRLLSGNLNADASNRIGARLYRVRSLLAKG